MRTGMYKLLSKDLAMIKELVKDEAILSQPCRQATAEDAAIAQDLLDTMASIDDAACLAANQIGETVAICAVLDEEADKTYVMFNPSMKRALGPEKKLEFCLSRSEDEPVKVTRFQKITVHYQELVDSELVARKRDMYGWMAQLVQHMIDHCKGKLV